MGYIGNFPTALPLTSSDLPDDIVTSAKIADGSITSADTDGSIGKPAFKNLIINGDMSIHQRGTNVTANNDFGVDRFKYNESANFDERIFTFGQDTDVPTGQGFAKSMKVNVTTPETTIASDEYARISTRLEGQNLQQLKFGTSSAESVTLSFWLKTNVTGNFAVSLLLDDDSRIIGNTYSATSSGVWEKITITFEGDTTGVIDNDNGSGMRIIFITDAGSNFTSSDNTSWGSYSNGKLGYGQTASVFGTTSGYWNVTGVQLEVGTSASDFEFLPYDVNLRRCLRYFYGSSGSFNMQSLKGGDTSGAYLNIFYETMRTEPSLSNCSQASGSDLGINQGFIITGSSSVAVTSYNLDSEL